MGQNGSESLLKLDGVTKVFFTDEVETHALAGVQMEIRKGEYVSIAGPSGCGPINRRASMAPPPRADHTMP